MLRAGRGNRSRCKYRSAGGEAGYQVVNEGVLQKAVPVNGIVEISSVCRPH